MTDTLLSVRDLRVEVEGKLVVGGVSFVIDKAKVIALTGANGSGKSSLAMAMLGDSRFKVQGSSRMMFDSVDLLKMSVDERARAGLFVAWQNPVIIPGMSIFSLCKASYESRGKTIDKLTKFKVKLEELTNQVGLPKQYINRNVNEGLSGGEKKRLELMQLLLLQPKLAILDEMDSGMDSEGVKKLIRIVNEMRVNGTSFVLITHNRKLLDEIEIDETWEMRDGSIHIRA